MREKRKSGERGVGSGKNRTRGRGRKAKPSSEGLELDFGEDDAEPDVRGAANLGDGASDAHRAVGASDASPDDASPVNGMESEADSLDQRNVKPPAGETLTRAIPIDQIDTDAIMAAFRQAARGRGWLERERASEGGVPRPPLPAARPAHRRSPPGPSTSGDPPADHRGRRTIPGPLRHGHDGRLRPGRTARDVSVGDAQGGEVRAGRSDLLASPGTWASCALTDTIREAIKSAINSAIRRGVLAYEGCVLRRVD